VSLRLLASPARLPILKSMEYEVLSSPSGRWFVEAIRPDGECESAMFCGPKAEERAREYAAWKQFRVPGPPDPPPAPPKGMIVG
jgi:hypothetical protein